MPHSLVSVKNVFLFSLQAMLIVHLSRIGLLMVPDNEDKQHVDVETLINDHDQPWETNLH